MSNTKKALAQKTISRHQRRKIARALACCGRCGWSWKCLPGYFDWLKEPWLDRLLQKFKNETFVFQFKADRERFRAAMALAVEELLLPRVCPHCKSPYWDAPRRRKQITGIAAELGRKNAAGSKVAR